MDGLGLCDFEAGLEAPPFPGPIRIKVLWVLPGKSGQGPVWTLSLMSPFWGACAAMFHGPWHHTLTLLTPVFKITCPGSGCPGEDTEAAARPTQGENLGHQSISP